MSNNIFNIVDITHLKRMLNIEDDSNENIASLLERIINSINDSEADITDTPTATALKSILQIANNIKNKIIHNTKELTSFKDELSNIETKANSVSMITTHKQSIRETLAVIFGVTSYIKREIIREISPSLEVTSSMPTPNQVVPTSTQAVLTSSLELAEIGLSTRPGGYKKDQPSWINIKINPELNPVLNNKIKSILNEGLKPDEHVSKWEDCQFIGGFDIPNGADLDRLDPSSVLQRLNKLATNNIVALSELIKNGKTDVSTMLTSKLILGCVFDVGFVTDVNKDIGTYNGVTEKPSPDKAQKIIQEITERRAVLSYNTLNILSIHFPSDGPKQKEGVPPKTILKFITDELDTYSFEDKAMINVICGDTNITTNKCKPQKSRAEIGTAIAQALNNYFNTSDQEWIVLMSSHKIEKTRHGFILRNQQLSKSTPQNYREIDADGTILAVKVYKTNSSNIISQWKKELTTNNNVTGEYMFSYSDNNESFTEGITVGEALFFNKDINYAINCNSEPTEKIFIDHSVLYSKLCSLEKYTADDISKEPTNPASGNLIVLNLGSMVNAGGKNWNLQHRNKHEKIKILDKKLYEIFKENNVFYNANKITNLQETYEDFNGTDKLYNPEISPDTIKNINEQIEGITLSTPSGGRKSRRSRKSRRPRRPRITRRSRRPRRTRRSRRSRRSRRR